MAGVQIEITLVLLLEFFNSQWRPDFPRLNSNNLTLSNVRINKKRQGIKDDIRTVLEQFFIINYGYCIQPNDQKLLNIRKSLLSKSEKTRI